jgi:hypothetical protein
LRAVSVQFLPKIILRGGWKFWLLMECPEMAQEKSSNKMRVGCQQFLEIEFRGSTTLENGQTPNSLQTSSCSQKWLSGVAAGKRGDLASQRQLWAQSFACSQHYLPLLQAAAPQDRELALLASQLYPRSAPAWFWLGDASYPVDRPAALQA